MRVALGHSVETTVSYSYEPKSKLSLAELKAKLLAYSAKDPGDLMHQFSDPQEIEEGVNLAQSIPVLFEFVGEVVCGKTAL
jgi:hypothetical protein